MTTIAVFRDASNNLAVKSDSEFAGYIDQKFNIETAEKINEFESDFPPAKIISDTWNKFKSLFNNKTENNQSRIR